MGLGSRYLGSDGILRLGMTSAVPVQPSLPRDVEYEVPAAGGGMG